MKSKKGTIALVALVLVAVIMLVITVIKLTGGNSEDTDVSSIASTSAEDSSTSALTDEFGNLLVTDENGDVVTEANGDAVTQDSTTEKETTTAASTTAANGDTLYIGRHETKLSTKGNSASALISAMAKETGWNLSVAGISSNSSAVFINWSDSCSIYTGSGMTATSTYYCSDKESLDSMILDSVKNTLQKDLGVQYVYFSDASGNDLVLDDVDATIDSNSPYTSFDNYVQHDAN